MESRPITSWRAAAQALGIHEDTLTRHREAAKHPKCPGQRPWFADFSELAAWYRSIRPGAEVRPAPRKASRPRRETTDAALDVADLRRELAGR